MTTPETPLPVALPEAVIEAVAANIWAGMVWHGYTFGGDDFADIHDHDKEAMRAIARDTIHAYAAEALRGREVDDAMVDRFIAAFNDTIFFPDYRSNVRAALDAAMAGEK